MIEKLLKLLKIKFQGELTLKDGTQIIVDGDLAVGAKVSVQSPDGLMELPDGSYELESGQIITVEKGLITDIVEQVETPEEPDQEPPVVEEEAKTPPAEEPKEETPPAEEAPPAEDLKTLATKIAELEAKIKELEAKTSNLSSETEKLTSETEKLNSENQKFNTDLDVIKQKANFVSELPKSSTPDVSVTTSPLVDKINRIRQLKK